MTQPLARMTVDQDSSVGGGRLLVRLAGEIDLSNAADLEAWLDDAMGSHERVAIDLTAVEYMDSQCVRVLERIARRHTSGAVDLVMVVAPDSIARDVLVLTHLTAVVPVVEQLA